MKQTKRNKKNYKKELTIFENGLDENSRIILFLFKFFLLLAVLYFVLLMVDFSWLENLIAQWVGNILPVTIQQNQIIISSDPSVGRFLINSSCTGLQSIFVLLAVIFSLGKPKLKEKIKLFALGSIALFAINWVRLVAVIGSGLMWGISTAEIIHIASWFAMTFAILGIWFVSVKKTTRIKRFNELL